MPSAPPRGGFGAKRRAVCAGRATVSCAVATRQQAGHGRTGSSVPEGRHPGQQAAVKPLAACMALEKQRKLNRLRQGAGAGVAVMTAATGSTPRTVHRAPCTRQTTGTGAAPLGWSRSARRVLGRRVWSQAGAVACATAAPSSAVSFQWFLLLAVKRGPKILHGKLQTETTHQF